MQNKNIFQPVIPTGIRPSEASQQLRTLSRQKDTSPQVEYVERIEKIEPLQYEAQSTIPDEHLELFGSDDRKVIDLRVDDDPKIYFETPTKPDADSELDLDALNEVLFSPDTEPAPMAVYEQAVKQGSKGRFSRAMGRVRNIFKKEDVQQAPAPEKRHKQLVRKAAVGVLAVAAVAAGIGVGVRGDSSAQSEKVAAPTEETNQAIGTILTVNPNSPVNVPETPAAETPAPEVAASEIVAEAPATPAAEQHTYNIQPGDMPWTVLERDGVPTSQITQQLKAAGEAAQADGVNVVWTGNGANAQISVNGHTDVQSVIHDLGPYLQR